MPPAIELRNVTKYYAKQAALENITLHIERGECFGLVGANGAGKTTLFKSLLDICCVNAGTIEIFGVSHLLPVSRASTAFLPERFLPPYYLTGRQFLQYMAALYKTTFQEEALQRLFAALQQDVAFLSKPARHYSKGMTQKLGVAACVLSGKSLYLLDEPTSGLDPKARAILRTLLLDLKAQKHTLVLSSHNLLDIEILCERMAIMHAGKVCFVGSPEVCRQTYNAKDLEQAYLNAIQ